MVGEPLIQLDNVYWQRQGKQILKNINWQVKKGEQWALVGLNGSGKTSILNIITGYHFPTSGSVTVLGERFGEVNIPKLREKIGYVSSALDRFGTTFNKQKVLNIILSGKFASVGIYSNQVIEAADNELASEILEQLGIAYLSEQAFRTLSQGEKRRVLIGRALMSQPKLLILDEPCSGLDIQAREEVLAMMDSITQLGCHVLYVTHYIEEITPVITHTMLVKDGEVVKSGLKKDILTDDLLSQTLNTPVKVNWVNESPWITIQR